MAKFFLVLSLIAAGAAAGLGWLTYQKIITERADLKTTKNTLTTTQQQLAATKQTLKDTLEQLTATKTQLDAANATIATDGTKIDGLTKDKADLQAKVDADTPRIAELEKQVAALTPHSGPSTDPTANPWQAKIDELNKQIGELKLNNDTLTKRVTDAEAHAAALTKAEDIRKANIAKKGVEGIVMAVNPGYGFAVVSLGDHQGSVPNAELIVERNGVQIAKLKVTTVEPALSVADIIPDSLAKGQRVLPGDKVIFSGDMVQQ